MLILPVDGLWTSLRLLRVSRSAGADGCDHQSRAPRLSDGRLPTGHWACRGRAGIRRSPACPDQAAAGAPSSQALRTASGIPGPSAIAAISPPSATRPAPRGPWSLEIRSPARGLSHLQEAAERRPAGRPTGKSPSPRPGVSAALTPACGRVGGFFGGGGPMGVPNPRMGQHSIQLSGGGETGARGLAANPAR